MDFMHQAPNALAFVLAGGERTTLRHQAHSDSAGPRPKFELGNCRWPVPSHVPEGDIVAAAQARPCTAAEAQLRRALHHEARTHIGHLASS